MGTVAQTVAAVIVLGAFVLTQARVFRAEAPLYLVLNVVGAGALAVDAFLEAQWGFLLLEGAWALVAAASVVRHLATTGQIHGPGGGA